MSDNNVEILFKKAVEQIFNNWTALQLAVEHQMGGPSSHQTAIEAMNWVTSYCLGKPDIQVDDIAEALEDILDEEFETICEDNSPKEVSHVLVKFLQCLKEGNLQQFEADFNNLPTCKIWLSRGEEPMQQVPVIESGNTEVSSNEPREMNEDQEWTVVHSRRNKS